MYFDYLDYSKLQPGDSFRMGGSIYVFKQIGGTKLAKGSKKKLPRPWIQFEVDGVLKKYVMFSLEYQKLGRNVEGCVRNYHGDDNIPPHLDDPGALLKCIVIQPGYIH